MNDSSTGARLLGVPLRPWAGTSPMLLIVRGLILTVLCLILMVACVRTIASGSATGSAGTARELSILHSLLVSAVVVLAVFALYGVLRVVVGVLDFVIDARSARNWYWKHPTGTKGGRFAIIDTTMR